MNESAVSAANSGNSSSTITNCSKTTGKRSLESDDDVVIINEIVSIESDTEEAISPVPMKKTVVDKGAPLSKKVCTSENQLSAQSQSQPPLTTTIERVTEVFSNAVSATSNLEAHTSESASKSKEKLENLKTVEVLTEIKKLQEKMTSYRQTIDELLKEIEANYW